MTTKRTPRALWWSLTCLALAVVSCGQSLGTPPSGGSGSSGTSGSGGGAPTCAAGQSVCAGSCVDLQTSSASCGACGASCPAGSSCSAGQCTCQTGFSRCELGCVDVTVHPGNCGACGTTCASGQVCSASACQCIAGLAACGASCVDVGSDVANCGACGAACPAGQVCTGGQCAGTCAAGETQCGADCVDVTSSVGNCGTCGNACPAGQSCTASLCSCANGRTACGAGCTDTQTDPMNCGACGTTCAAGQTCSAGQCTCPGGQTACAGQCVDTQSDPMNCGACGTTCQGGQTCGQGSCGCPGGRTSCGGACVNTMTDAANCGSCGSQCPAGATCSAGTCMGGTGGTGGAAGTGGSSGSGGMGGTGGSVGGDGFYHMERLDRGVVAVQVSGGVYVGWRMLGFEYDAANPGNVSYNVYRGGARVANVTNSTNYQDSGGNAQSQYTVRAVIGGTEGPASETAGVWAQNYLRIPITTPSSGHAANDGSVGDVDGDGQYEIFLKWDPTNAQDNANAGVTGNVYIDAIKLDGTRLWRVDLGPNIRAGAHYTQFIVMDFDDDGKAEMAVKTAPGTRDGTGQFLRLGPAANDDDAAVYRNSSGYILTGPEYLTVFSGQTGAELATVAFDVPRGTVSAWGDNYGNRVDRFLAAGAWLDDTGVPSFVMARGYYTRTTLTAWNFRGGQLTQLWKFDSNSAGNSWTGQGCHSLSVANTDSDPGQEIIYGAMTIDNNGTGKCNTSQNHGDALHVGDFVPSRPGLEVFMPHEYTNRPAWTLRDANTCAILRQGPTTTAEGPGRGVAADVSASNAGAEMWASSGIPFMSASTGATLSTSVPSINFLVWWDADESRELEDGTAVTKYGGGTLVSCSQCSSNNGTKSTPTLVADLTGDWREEVIWKESNSSALRLYTTTAVTTRRIYTLMHDPQYRSAISWQNVAYNQPPHPSFHIGSGMAAPPVPDIRVR